MVITFSKQDIQRKAAQRPKGYIDELKSIALSVNADGSMSFEDTDSRWAKLHKKYRVQMTYNKREIELQKKANAPKPTITVTKAPKKGGCGCHGKK